MITKMNDLTVPDRIKSVKDLYKAYTEGDGCAAAMIYCRSWYIKCCRFDPVTAEAIGTDMEAFLDTAGHVDALEDAQDRVTRLAEHVSGAVSGICKDMKSKIERVHEMQPVYAAREFDGATMRWLGTQPGRNAREKLSDRARIKAVRRLISFDTLENRLFKAFIKAFSPLFTAGAAVNRRRCPFVIQAQNWLKSPEAEEIKAWTNMPPNNILLQDKRYRKIWYGWRELLKFDEKITKDAIRLNSNAICQVFWESLSVLHASGQVRFMQQPLTFHYDSYEITSEMPVIARLMRGEQGGVLLCEISENGFTLHAGDIEATVEAEPERVCLTLKTSGQNFSICPGDMKTLSQQVSGLILGDSREHTALETKLPETAEHTLAVIDVCELRPKYMTTLTGPVRFPYILFQQNWVKKQRWINCGMTSGIFLGDDVPNVTPATFFFDQESDRQVKNIAIDSFVRSIKENINAHSIYYIVPDAIDDFSMDGLRKNVNYQFEKSLPLPKSIATVFSWLTSGALDNLDTGTENGLTVCVLALNGASLSVTPITGVYDRTLASRLPDTKGICWERHPTIESKYTEFYSWACKTLENYGCSTPSELVDLLGYSGLLSEAGKLSFYCRESGWFDIPADLSQALTNKIKNLEIGEEILSKALKSIKQNRTNRLVILAADHGIARHKGVGRHPVITPDSSSVEGAWLLARRQRLVGDIPLWKDHLPYLAIKVNRAGRMINFTLVNDQTVLPHQEGEASFEISERFTLPKGSPSYKFPLLQGSAGNAMRFQAELKSPKFPLVEDTECKLIMKYRYGADNPYQLIFEPLDKKKAGFASVKAEWTENSCMDDDLPVPKFPNRYSWGYFQKFPNRRGVTDLVNSCREVLENIAHALPCAISRNWAELWPNRTEGKIYRYEKTFTLVYYNGKSIALCPGTNYAENPPTNLSVGDKLYFTLKQTGNRMLGEQITFTGMYPYSITYEYINEQFRLLFFPSINLWNQGRGLDDNDMPGSLRETVLKIKPVMEDALNSGINDWIKSACISFLSRLHKDMPIFAVEKLIGFTLEKKAMKNFYNRSAVAYMLGTVETQWQKQILDNVFTYAGTGSRLIILSLAVWRYEGFLSFISVDRLKKVMEDLADELEAKDIGKMKKDLADERAKCKSYGNQTLSDLTRLYELMMALFRLRGFGDVPLKKSLNPGKELNNRYSNAIERAIEFFANNPNILLRPYIKLDGVTRPDSLRNTPVLLYALQLYLTGDDGANTIAITTDYDEEQ